MHSEDWGYGPAQQTAARVYTALETLMWERHRVLPCDLREFVPAFYPWLAPALDGFACAALDGLSES